VDVAEVDVVEVSGVVALQHHHAIGFTPAVANTASTAPPTD